MKPGPGQIARLAARRLGQHQGDVAGIVAVAGVTGALNEDLHRQIGGQCALALQGFDGGFDQGFEVMFHGSELDWRGCGKGGVLSLAGDYRHKRCFPS